MPRARSTLATLFIVGLFSVAATACSGASSGGAGTPTTGDATATSAARPKPTGVPAITVAFCQGLMTVAEANTFMKPATAATSIRVDTSPAGGSCNYEYAQFQSVVTVHFLPYQGGSLTALANQIANTPSTTVTTKPVSGVGDQALFVAATITSVNLRQDYLDAVDGAVLLQCFNPNVGAASDDAQLAALTQVCQQVIARL